MTLCVEVEKNATIKTSNQGSLVDESWCRIFRGSLEVTLQSLLASISGRLKTRLGCGYITSI